MPVTRYLIDIRMMGPVRRHVRTMSARLQENFGIADNLTVPHITLAGPFSTDDEDRLVADFARVCSAQETVPRYEAGGYGFFEDTRVVFVTVTPDEALRRFRYRLAQAIAPYCTLRDYDRDDEETFRFHATLAMKLDWLAFQRIRWFIRGQRDVTYYPHPVRATLLRNAKVLCEYDFVQQRMLTPSQAKSRATWMRDLDALKAWEDGGEGEE